MSEKLQCVSWSAMYGRRGGKYVVAIRMGPCGVSVSTAVSGDVKLS